MAQAGTLRRVSRLPAERRILDIMTAARAVFTEKGYNDALISDIAERAGVVEGSIYRFFTNKRDLLVRVVEHWYEDMLADDDEQFASVRGTWNRFVSSSTTISAPSAASPRFAAWCSRNCGPIPCIGRRGCSSSIRLTPIASSKW